MDQSETRPSRPSKKTKKRALRAAFVVTTSIGALGAAGCDATSNPPFVECPDTTPSYGADCDPDVGSCTYQDECGSEIVASCGEDGAWDVEFTGTCNPPPPPPECPATVPGHAEPCGEEIECTYQDECGQDFSASCANGVWVLGEPFESCNPPPPCPIELPAEGEACELTPGGTPEGCTWDVETSCGPVTASGACIDDGAGVLVWQISAPQCTPEQPSCASYGHAALCGADTTCRWLVPGCGEEPQPAFEGCYPIADCTQDSCPLDETCSTLTYNPCWNSACDACGADASICLPAVDGG